ncbi:hypothetical protein AB6A40_002302 [Gnathostoma spinigerum]|uniref:Transthyretin-like family protein n=1 Tax=Gnathostoma spinigerum TaxID=75299 RepID=A0ABD6E676_9BILA
MCLLKTSYIFVLLWSSTGAQLNGTQSVGVVGRLLCFGQPMSDVLVKLYDVDKGLNPDDLVDQSRSLWNGAFVVSGSVDERSPIDPKLNIYHDCNDGWKPCQRKISFIVPPKYISKGSLIQRFFNVGTLELADEYPNETRDCFH